MSHRVVANQAKCLDTSLLKRLFVDQRLFWFGDCESRVVAHALQSHWRSRRGGKRKKLPKRSEQDFWDINISFNQSLLPEIVMATSYQAKELVPY